MQFVCDKSKRFTSFLQESSTATVPLPEMKQVPRTMDADCQTDEVKVFNTDDDDKELTSQALLEDKNDLIRGEVEAGSSKGALLMFRKAIFALFFRRQVRFPAIPIQQSIPLLAAARCTVRQSVYGESLGGFLVHSTASDPVCAVWM